MSYHTTFLELCEAGDLDGAFAFVQGVFCDPANQKIKGRPTDFLHERRRAKADPDVDDEDDAEDDDGDDDRKLTPKEGFEAIVQGFKPKASAKTIAFVLDRLDESREEGDITQPMQPFNALVAQIGTYERGSVALYSAHVPSARAGHAAREARRIQQYGLGHEIVSDQECREKYTFTYDMEHSDRYQLARAGETLDNAELLRDLKLTIFARYLRGLFDALVANRRFARFPKALPFRFEVVTTRRAASSGEPSKIRFAVRAGLTLDAVEQSHPKLADDYRAASELLREADPIRLVAFRMLQASQGEREGLEELVKGDPSWGPTVTTLAEEAMATASRPWEWVDTAHGHRVRRRKGEPERTPPAQGDRLADLRSVLEVRDPAAFSSVLWALGDDAASLGYAKRCFALSPAAWSGSLREDRELLSELEVRWNKTWESAPQRAKDSLRAAFESARSRLLESHPPAWVNVLALELGASDEEGLPDEDADEDEVEVDEDGDDQDLDEGDLDGDGRGVASAKSNEVPLERLPLGMETDTACRLLARLDEPAKTAYVNAVVAYGETLRGELSHAGGDAAKEFERDEWNFLIDRLIAIGEPARAAIPTLLALFEARSNGQLKGWVDDYFFVGAATALFRMGLEEPPPGVHAVNASNEFYMEAFYKKWAAAVPERRLAALLEKVRATPDAAKSPALWESHLTDSEPGMALVEKRLFANAPALIDLACVAAETEGAGPLLTKLLVRLAKTAERKEKGELVFRCLSPIRALDEDGEKLKARASLYGLLAAISASSDDVPARIASLERWNLTSQSPMFLFARAWQTLRGDGPRAAAERTLEAVRLLSEHDLVYRKAFFAAMGRPDTMADFAGVDRGRAYGFFRLVEDAVSADLFESGKPSGALPRLTRDVFYDALYAELQKTSAWVADNAAALANRLAAYGEELAFVEQCKDASLESLEAKLPKASWEIGYWIAKRLATEPSEPRAKLLLDLFAAHANDPSRRMQVARLLWPLAAEPAIKTAILSDSRFQANLGWLIEKYPGVASVTLAREVFSDLLHMGLPKVAVACARQLSSATLIHANIAVLSAFDASGDIDGAIALLTKLRDESNPKDPNTIVLHSNLAVQNIKAQRYDAAEAIFDRLFGLDFSQFDYVAEEEDASFKEILGGDLDAQYAEVFRIQMANAHYNAACLYALTNRPERTVASLRESCRLRPATYTKEKLASEEDFASLRGRADFDALGAAANEVSS